MATSMGELGEELDRMTSRLSDFEGSPEMLGDHLSTKFGQHVMAAKPKKSTLSPVDNSTGILLGEPSQYHGYSLEPVGSVVQTATDERSPALTVPTGDAQDTVPPKTTSVSHRSENAIYTGRPCHMCRMPIKSSAEYQLVGKVFENVTGNCPDEIPARDVFEPSGELRERLRYG